VESLRIAVGLERRFERRRFAVSVLLALAAFSPSALPASFPEPLYELMAPGVAYGRVELRRGPLVYHVVKADIRAAGLRIEPIRAEGAETLAQMVERLLERREPLIAAINGDYFDRKSGSAVPWGVHVTGGKLLFSPTAKSAFLIGPKGRPFIGKAKLKLGIRFGKRGAYLPVAAVNRPRAKDRSGFFVYTPAWGATVQAPLGGLALVLSGGELKLGPAVSCVLERMELGGAEVEIPEGGMVITHENRRARVFARLKIGGAVVLRGVLEPPARSAIGGGPRLVRRGKVSVEFNEENFSPSHVRYLSGRHPRSAVGYDRSRTAVLLVVVEGRTKSSAGISMQGLAQLMCSLGAYEAMAFDGGGSSTLYVAGMLVGWGSTGKGNVAERRLANALGIFYKHSGRQP